MPVNGRRDLIRRLKVNFSYKIWVKYCSYTTLLLVQIMLGVFDKLFTALRYTTTWYSGPDRRVFHWPVHFVYTHVIEEDSLNFVMLWLHRRWYTYIKLHCGRNWGKASYMIGNHVEIFFFSSSSEHKYFSCLDIPLDKLTTNRVRSGTSQILSQEQESVTLPSAVALHRSVNR